jgi:hypothetical protein
LLFDRWLHLLHLTYTSMRHDLRLRIVATRIHTNCGSTFPDLSQFASWCERALEYGDYILIATDDLLFQSIRQMCAHLERVHAVHVSPWHGFSTPLNAIVAEAGSLNGDTLLMQSFEIFVSRLSVETMHGYLSDDTLVVGARLSPEHGGDPGIKPIDGLTTPWNTLALWDLNKLRPTGFLDMSTALPDQIPGGMEEVPTISLLQHQSPDAAKAKIVTLSEVEWDVAWNDSQRSLYHYQKMITKHERAELQLKHLWVPRGMVTVL